MEQLLICMSLSLIAGLLASRAAKAVRLPAVTSYLVAGLLLGPFFLGRLGLSGWGFGFGSLAQVESYGIITQVALGFIAFVIGNEFRLSALESMGRQAVTVGILQAVITTVLVDIALVALHFARPDVISMASAITLGSIASATAPAATLMVVKQYKASGPLPRLLNQLEIYFHSRSKRMSLSVAFVLLTVGLSMVSFEVGPIHCSFSLLLVCMMTGTVFCNICPTSDELMDRLDRWVSPVNIRLYRFPLSGQDLRLLCQLQGHPLQREDPEVSGHHPAAAGRCGTGYGRRGCRAFRWPHGAQRGALLGAGVRAGRPDPGQAQPDRRRRDHSRGPHERPYHQQAGGASVC